MVLRERTLGFAGAVVLIALGILILLHVGGIYGFDKSWPILLIVLAFGTLARRIEDIGGWFIGIVGIVFIAMEKFYPSIEPWAQYVLPSILLLLGLFLLFDFFKKSKKEKS